MEQRIDPRTVSSDSLFTIGDPIPEDASGRKGLVLWVAPDNHPVFSGHFPGEPVVPGACSLEAMLEGLRVLGIGVEATAGIKRVKWLLPIFPAPTSKRYVMRVDVKGKRCLAELLDDDGRITLDLQLDVAIR